MIRTHWAVMKIILCLVCVCVLCVVCCVLCVVCVCVLRAYAGTHHTCVPSLCSGESVERMESKAFASALRPGWLALGCVVSVWMPTCVCVCVCVRAWNGCVWICVCCMSVSMRECEYACACVGVCVCLSATIKCCNSFRITPR